MKLYTKLFILFGLVALGLFFAWNHLAIFPLNAVVSDPSSEFHEIPLKKEEKSTFVAVLTQYGEHFRERENDILITPRLYFDQLLRWKYSSKKINPDPKQ